MRRGHSGKDGARRRVGCRYGQDQEGGRDRDHRSDGDETLALAMGSGRASTQVDAPSRAIAYLQGEQSASDGAIPVGSSTDAVSEEYAIGAAAAGYDPNALRHGAGPSVMTYLSTHAAAACATAGACGELIQAVAAAGLNPASFGGVDLLTSLDGFYDARHRGLR